MTRFQLLCTLTLASVIAPMVRLCFAMHERKEDKTEKSNRKDSKQEKRARMRAFFKGPLVEVQRGPDYIFADVSRAANRAVDQLWKGEIFHVASAFWPPLEPKSKLYEKLAEERLLNVAQVKWRLSCKFLVPPFNVCWVDRYDDFQSLPSAMQSKFEECVADLVSQESCCLDPFWAKPVQRKLQTLREPQRAEAYFKLAKEFLRNFRPASLKEERAHSFQRRIAGGHTSMSRTYPQQAAACVVGAVADNYRNRGGRNLHVARTETRKAAKRARVRKCIYKRPAQFGNPMFYYISKQRAMGCLDARFDTLKQQWKEMGLQSRQVWSDMQKCEKRRIRNSQMPSATDGNRSQPFKTPWNVGCDDWPLKLEILDEFMDRFRKRDSGIRALQECASSACFPLEKECLRYKKQVEEGEVKYHSMSAASIACKAITACSLTDETVPHVKTAEQILQTQAPRHHCMSKHLGACQLKHHQEIVDINNMVKILPREGCVLRFEMSKGRAKKLVYAKLTVGQAWGVTKYD